MSEQDDKGSEGGKMAKLIHCFFCGNASQESKGKWIDSSCMSIDPSDVEHKVFCCGDCDTITAAESGKANEGTK